MRRVIIGHRGVGKSSLLRRHQIYFTDIPHFDLDTEIEQSVGQVISDFFKSKGESAFREQEKICLNKIIKENTNFVVALGAGFDLTFLPDGLEVLLIRRLTDHDGRIFFNRPRLEPELTPLEEYKKRYKERQEFYTKYANCIYDLPEGIDQPSEIEKNILQKNFNFKLAYYTLRKSELSLVHQILKNFEKIELRTDLLDPVEIESLLSNFPDHHFMVSFRNHLNVNTSGAKEVDRDYIYFKNDCTIASTHSDRISTGILQLEEINQGQHLKLCPIVSNFDELKLGHEWRMKDPSKRSFLPRSTYGQWVWYRQLMQNSQKLNFVKAKEFVLDQPSLFDCFALPLGQINKWAAVLGSPVYFSRSPVYHQSFFFEKKTFMTKIDISEAELNTHFQWLVELGLTYAAVTAPLKEAVFGLLDEKTDVAIKFKSANTLFIRQKKIIGHNTDVDGFKELVRDLNSSEPLAIWGGGGTLEMMKTVLPKAHLFSSQTAKLREEPQSKSEHITKYEALIWAAPRSHKTQFPPERMQFGRVIDLNYTDNSMGLEFATIQKISYTSGLKMFHIQAKEQQKFWNSKEEQIERK